MFDAVHHRVRRAALSGKHADQLGGLLALGHKASDVDDHVHAPDVVTLAEQLPAASETVARSREGKQRVVDERLHWVAFALLRKRLEDALPEACVLRISPAERRQLRPDGQL
jgi:hypothetical protein